MYNFKNKNVLITGSTRGIGKATALYFADCGANIILNYLNSENEADKLSLEIKNKGVECIAIKCDVSDEKKVEAMVNEIKEKFSKIDFLVNNVGSVSDKPILEKTTSDWIDTLKINLISQYLVTKFSQKIMPAGSRIVNVSSTSAIYTFDPNIADYDSSKAGVITLTKNYAKSLAPNINVNCVIPGWINTDLNKGVPKELMDDEINQTYLKRLGEPIEVAKVIAFLCSEESNFITGNSIIVNGGHD